MLIDFYFLLFHYFYAIEKSRMFLSFWYYVLGIQHDCLITTERIVHAQYLLVIDYGCGVSFFFLIFFLQFVGSQYRFYEQDQGGGPSIGI